MQARPWPGLEASIKLIRAQENFHRRQNRPADIVAPAFIAIAGFLPEMLRRCFAAGHLHDPRSVRQVIKQAGQLIEKQWQVVFQTAAGQAFGNILIERAVAMIDIEAFAKGAAKMADAIVAERELCRWQQGDIRHRFTGALAVRIEQAQRFDFVIEQLDPKWLFRAHRKNIHDGAAHGEFTMFIDVVALAIAGAGKP